MSSRSEHQRERAALELDLRLVELWRTIGELPDEITLDFFIACLRAAYGLGHSDALSEDDPLSFYDDLGFARP